MDLYTGQRNRLLENIQAADQWRFVPSSDKRTVALTLGSSNFNRVSSGGSLYLANVDGQPAQQISTQAAVNPSWSPDGTELAFITHDVNVSPLLTNLNVVTADGQPVQSVPLNSVRNDYWSISWTQCH